MKKQFIETGKIVGTHGIKGEMRVQPWSDSPEYLTGFSVFYLDDKGESKLEATAVRAHKNVVLLAAKNVDTIEQAEKLRGKTIYINRDDADIEEGRYFVDDLIGCHVFDSANDTEYGKITAVSCTGANDVWHITSDNGKEYLIPAIPDVVDAVDTDAEKVLITPLKGIFDDED